MVLASRSTTMRRAGVFLALVAFELAAVVVLHRLGELPWLRVPFDDLEGWLRTSAPEDVLAAVVRLIALGAAWWLLGSTALYALARLSRIPAAITALERVTLPSVRRIADQAIALTLATSIMSGGANAAIANPAGIPIRPESVVASHDPLSTWTRASTLGYRPAPGTADPPSYQPEAAGPATTVAGTGQPAGGAQGAAPAYRPEAAGSGAGQAQPGYQPRPAGKGAEAAPGAGATTTSSTSPATTSSPPSTTGHPTTSSHPTTTSPPSTTGHPTTSSHPSTTSPPSTTSRPSTTSPPSSPSTTGPPTTRRPARAQGTPYVPRVAGTTPGSTRPPSPAAPRYTPRPAGPPGRPPAPLPEVPPVTGQTTLYHVVQGDNLWTIARDHLAKVRGRPAGELSEREIARYWLDVVDANRASLRSGDPDLIFPGEIIKLPPVARHEP
jgi:hypothetical protein